MKIRVAVATANQNAMRSVLFIDYFFITPIIVR